MEREDYSPQSTIPKDFSSENSKKKEYNPTKLVQKSAEDDKGKKGFYDGWTDRFYGSKGSA
ncbi:MAG: hypothetical protein BAJALOKI2v1_1040007 [Promethearchaeota archaeon]|nr:MAG: hypothetical protein BAJALOKI2v1_1040007 [Candidatus Lokiarchaeota archaeon]